MTAGAPAKPSPSLAVILLLIVGATMAAYANTLGVPFLLDDQCAITSNPSTRHLADVARVLWPPETATTAGRPLLNLSFAFNYAIGGFQPASYHVVNLAVHLAAGLTLFGIVRRTLSRGSRSKRAGRGGRAEPLSIPPVTAAARLAPAPDRFAVTIALLWLLNPLQTEAVTYISERAESLMALCALLTLYGFVRATEVAERVGPTRSASAAVRRYAWQGASVAACMAGMGVKEVMVTVPVVVLLYDRAFVSGSFAGALARRRWYYAGLALSWALLAGLMCGAHVLAHPSVGFDTPAPLAAYWATEAKALVQYARLAAWPHPLVFDYGPDGLLRWRVALPFAAAVVIALASGVLLARRRHPAGFLLLTYFLLLAPTALVPVAFDPMAESRAYLPSAALITLLGGGAFACAGRRALPVLGLIALVFAGLTWHRNLDYASASGLWAQTAADAPGNSRAHYALGYELAREPAQRGAALAELAAALRIRPDYPEALSRFADLLAATPGHEAEAIDAYGHALRLQPAYAVARNNLANLLARLPGRQADALAQYRAAVRSDPGYRQAHYNLANLLARTPAHWPEAIAQYQRAIALDPGYALARNNLGLLYAAEGRTADAVAQWRLALEADPRCAVARLNLRQWGRPAP